MWACQHGPRPLPSQWLVQSVALGTGLNRWLSPATAPTMVSRGCALPGPMYVGLWDFEARTEEELSFQAGDLFHVTRKEEEWWWAELLDASGRSLAEGYVPHNYLAEKETVESEL